MKEIIEVDLSEWSWGTGEEDKQITFEQWWDETVLDEEMYLEDIARIVWHDAQQETAKRCIEEVNFLLNEIKKQDHSYLEVVGEDILNSIKKEFLNEF